MIKLQGDAAERAARADALNEYRRDNSLELICPTAAGSDLVHYHKRTKPEAGMGPTCGAECCYCANTFSPEAVEEYKGVRFGEDGTGVLPADGWVCRGCQAVRVLAEMRVVGESPGSNKSLQLFLQGDWP